MKRLVMGTLSAVILAGSMPVCETEAAGEDPGSQIAAFSDFSDSEGSEVTETPEPTEAPEPTPEPEPTEAPAPTEAPVPTETPEPTEAPGPTQAPQPTEAPVPTGTPSQEERSLELTQVRAIRTADNEVVLLYHANEEGQICFSAVREGQQPVFDFENTARSVTAGQNQQSVNIPAEAGCEIYMLVQDQNGRRAEEPVKVSVAAVRKVHLTITADPSDASVSVRNELGREITGTKGIYVLYKGEQYEITVSKEGYETKTETITADTKTTQHKVTLTGTDADLRHLYISSSDTYGKGILKLDPSLKKDHDRYKASYDGERQSLNLWPEAAPGASVKVYALSGIKTSTVQKDETIKGTQDKEKHPYWKIYFAAQEKEVKVRVHVTAQNGNTRDYYLTLSLTDKTAPELKKVSASRVSEDTASVVYKTSEKGNCYYQVGEAGAKIPTPDTGSRGTEVQAGTNVITLTGLSAGEKDLVIVVKDIAGNISKRLVIRIPDIKKKDLTQQDNTNNTAQRPGYGGHKSEVSLPGQNNGEGSLDKLKTVQAKEKSAGTKNGKDADDTDQNGKKTLTVYGKPDKKDDNKKNGGNSKKQTETEKSSKTDKTAAKSTKDTADKEQGSNTTEDKITDQIQQKTETNGAVGKISHIWKNMRRLTRILLIFALAGTMYLGFFAGARRHYKKIRREFL